MDDKEYAKCLEYASDQFKEAVSAIRAGDLDRLESVFTQELVNKTDETKYSEKTLLHYAAREGNLDIVKYLTIKGIDAKVTDHYRTTPLFDAAYGGHIDVVKYLVEKGCGVNKTDKHGETPLFNAAGRGHIDVVKYLVEKGCGVNQTDKRKRNPLFDAAYGGHIDVVKYLVEKGCDVNQTNMYDQTPLFKAAEGGHIDVVKYLVEKGCGVNQTDDVGQTPLFNAAKGGHIDVIKYLIKKGCDVNQNDKFGRTPLFFSAEGGHIDVTKYLVVKTCPDERQHIEVIKYLIERGIDVNKTDSKKQNSLFFTVFGGNIDVVEYLVEMGFNVDQEVENGQTLLFYAAKKGYIYFVRDLIEKHNVSNQTDINGRTLLFYATEINNHDVVKCLVENDCDVNHCDHVGENALYVAIENDALEIAQYLVSKNASVDHIVDEKRDKMLIRIASDGHFDIMNSLIGYREYKEPKLTDNTLSGLAKFKYEVDNNRKNVQTCLDMLESAYPSILVDDIKDIVKRLNYISGNCDKIYPLMSQSKDLDILTSGKVSDILCSVENSYTTKTLNVLDKELGSGAFGSVRLGEAHIIYVLSKCHVAVKCFKISFDVKLVINEIDILSKLRNDYLVGFYGYKIDFDYKENDTCVNLIMELCKEDCKKYYIDDGQSNNRNPGTAMQCFEVSLYQFLNHAKQLFSGLSHIHSKRILHKDLKLANILISWQNNIKVTDFGLADLVKGDIEETNTFKGTRVYSAPEVLTKPRKYSAASDIFSTGLILAEMYQGQIFYHLEPFKSSTRNVISLLNDGERPALGDRLETKDVLELINNCWSGDVQVRPNASDATLTIEKLMKKMIEKNPESSTNLENKDNWSGSDGNVIPRSDILNPSTVENDCATETSQISKGTQTHQIPSPTEILTTPSVVTSGETARNQLPIFSRCTNFFLCCRRVYETSY